MLGRIDGWWNEFHRDVIQREISRVLVLNLLWQRKRCSRTAQEISVLTTPSLLSRGTRPDKLPDCGNAGSGQPCYPGVTGEDVKMLRQSVKWYLCGNGPFDNIRNYTLEGFSKGAIVGGFAGAGGGPPGIALGALEGGIEGWFGGTAIGTVATRVCQTAGAYGTQ